MPKQATRVPMYALLYGKEARMPSSIELLALDIIRQMEVLKDGAMTIILAKSLRLEEQRRIA